ncbi:MAG: ROK family protein [Candidatus Omnitrophica bacterium]|nr:ROK family protein [Candidatus Omnitrophota bacterium]
MKNKCYIGVDVGGTKISGALINLKGKILIRAKIPSPKKAQAKGVTNAIACVIAEILKKTRSKKITVLGIGIGVPGIVDVTRRKIINTPNIRLSGVLLASIIQKKFKIKVLLENDVNLGTLGEKTFGSAKHARNVVGLFPGTGIGGGIIINNELVSGSHGAAGELGHMIMDLRGPFCGCGNRGCLEALASRWAIERDIHKAIKNHKKTIIKKLIKNNLAVIKSGILKEALKKKDSLTKKIMSEKSKILGQACINLRRIFDPEMIILGGGLIEACGDFMLPIIRKTVRADRFFKKLKPCPILPSTLGDDAVLLGAAALFKLVNTSA